jgi:hypothetical protein
MQAEIPMKPADIQRRQDIAQYLYNLWTTGGSDPSALAPLIVDGRVDLLGAYVTFSLTDDDSDENDNGHQEIFHEEDDKENSCCQQETLPRIHCDELSYQDFVSKYMRPNQPIMIQGLTQKWKSRSWLMKKQQQQKSQQMDHQQQNENDALVPNLNYLKEVFGNDTVQVHRQEIAGFSSCSSARPKKMEMTLAEYADWWNEYHSKRQNAAPQDHNNNEEEEEHPEQLLYLKDWKFVANHFQERINNNSNPYVNDAYEWPIYFRDDWLNGPDGSMGDAYKFIYLGPQGTVTGLHADVLRSFSWSTNVCGKKLWYLVPPEYTYLLYDCFGKSLARHMHAGPSFLFPGLAQARNHAIRIVQYAGETLFVPSQWHHTVENLAPTLSINHNWLNGSNIHWGWQKLNKEIMALRAQENNQVQSNQQQQQLSGAMGNSVQQQETTHQSNENENVGDDLHTLSLLLSNKVHQIAALARTKSAAHNLEVFKPWEDEETRIFNLKAILPILEGIRSVISNGDDLGLAKRWDCDIDSLILSVKAMLSSKNVN